MEASQMPYSYQVAGPATKPNKQKKIKEIEGYTSEYILSESKKNKTQYALVYANAIARSSKEIPDLFVALFNRIKSKLS